MTTETTKTASSRPGWFSTPEPVEEPAPEPAQSSGGWFSGKAPLTPAPAPVQGPIKSKSPGWFTGEVKTEPELPPVLAEELPEEAPAEEPAPDRPGAPSGLKISVGHKKLPKCDIWEKHIRCVGIARVT